jgi:hypothetical protein
MTLPLFVQVQDSLVNLSQCERVVLEDETVSFATAADSFDFEFDTESEAQRAWSQLQALLGAKNLLLGRIP